MATLSNPIAAAPKQNIQGALWKAAYKGDLKAVRKALESTPLNEFDEC